MIDIKRVKRHAKFISNDGCLYVADVLPACMVGGPTRIATGIHVVIPEGRRATLEPSSYLKSKNIGLACQVLHAGFKGEIVLEVINEQGRLRWDDPVAYLKEERND
mgnify:CR=1 FL=1